MSRLNKVVPILGSRLLLGTVAILLIGPFPSGPPPARAEDKKTKPATEAKTPAPKSKSGAKKSPILPKPHPQASKHPEVYAAMQKLEEAWLRLEQAKPVFGGYQVAAMELVAAAYEHLNAGIQGTPGKAPDEKVLLRPLPKGRDFPDIRSALSKIHQAQQKLEKASAMQGNRVAAIAILNDSIVQLEEGMKLARTQRK
jgi:hypothetical protein